MVTIVGQAYSLFFYHFVMILFVTIIQAPHYRFKKEPENTGSKYVLTFNISIQIRFRNAYGGVVNIYYK